MQSNKHYFLVIFLLMACQLLASNPNEIGLLKPAELARVKKPWIIEDFRFGGGVGYGLYITNQMDYEITTNYGDFKELIPTYFGAVYKKVNQSIEMGVQARFGSLLTLKSDNSQGTSCDFNEAQFSFIYSFNHNVSMDKKPFTFNGIFSLGAINFRSKYFTVNPRTEREDRIIASVGYEGEIKTGRIQAERQTAMIGNVGVALGYKLTENFSLYWENTVNVSSSNKMTGNLFKRSLIPPDNYFYSSIGLFIRFGSRRGQLGCPKF